MSTVGIAKLERFVVPVDQGIRAAVRGEYIEPGEYTRLFVNGGLMMSDTPFEKRTNWRVMRQAHGNVLIAGLGVGMVLPSVLEHADGVTVVEKYQDVIDLVGPQFQCSKLSMVCADIFKWEPPSGAKFDVIYFDIWPDICTDNLPDMCKLHRRFASKLNRHNPKAWMDSWMCGDLKAQRRREARRRR